MTRTRKQRHPARFFCVNPVTNRMQEVFPESEITDAELVIPKFWSGSLGYITIPGTEFYGRVPVNY